MAKKVGRTTISRRNKSWRPYRVFLPPIAGTTFMDIRTPTRVWSNAIYLFVTTRHGVSGKEVERTLGMTNRQVLMASESVNIRSCSRCIDSLS